MKGLNPGAMLENPKQKGLNPGTMPENLKQKKGSNVSKGCKEGAIPQYEASIPCQKPTTAYKVKVTKLEILHIHS